MIPPAGSSGSYKVSWELFAVVVVALPFLGMLPPAVCFPEAVLVPVVVAVPLFVALVVAAVAVFEVTAAVAVAVDFSVQVQNRSSGSFRHLLLTELVLSLTIRASNSGNHFGHGHANV